MIDAIFNPGNIYLNGTLVEPKNPVFAGEWFQKCADAGDTEAQHILVKAEIREKVDE